VRALLKLSSSQSVSDPSARVFEVFLKVSQLKQSVSFLAVCDPSARAFEVFLKVSQSAVSQSDQGRIFDPIWPAAGGDREKKKKNRSNATLPDTHRCTGSNMRIV
jgi:hypothetical protein